jgi:RNA polymerase sigma factor (sigma-70 family)
VARSGGDQSGAREALRGTPHGGRGGFEELYDDHVWDVYGFFAYRLGSRADAEDLTQLTFERALRAWHRFDPARAQPVTWLLAIARNLLIDHYRRDRSREREPADYESFEEALPAVAPPEPGGMDPELAGALGQLSQRDREVLALRFGGDLTGPEIAEMLDLSLANVQQILSRALRRLRGILDEETHSPSTERA